jgi:protoheme IX farnesyltransferase
VTTPAIAAPRSRREAFLELTKPRITFLVTLTTLVGFVLGAGHSVSVATLGATLISTALVAAGASTLNMYLERRVDALMHRTRGRPLPSGQLRPIEALTFGLLITLAGLVGLGWFTNRLSVLVAFATWASYLFAYTPLKTRTSLSTIVGAVPGALPPVIGWTAAGRGLEPGAFVLFAILFLWQIPHFLAIAWLYREDYARGGLPMLPVLDPEGLVTGRQAVAHCLALLVVSLTPTAAGLAADTYLVGAIVLGLGYTASAVAAAIQRDRKAARRLFVASIVYLPLLCGLLLFDRT